MESKRILLVNEASFLPSGLGKYGHNLLAGLKAAGHTVAELTTGRAHNDPLDDREWRVYGTQVSKRDPRRKDYDSDPDNRYGKWRFETVCLHFKPDVVMTILDPWTVEYIEHSPARKYFSYIMMPTIDSIPVKPKWLAMYHNVDKLLTYSEWAAHSMKAKGIKCEGAARYGVDFNKYFPVKNKAVHKQKYALDTDSFIVGTVAKNQPRKSFPELIKVASEVIKENPSVMFYCHTTYPDKMAWDFPFLMNQAGVANNMLFTYTCLSCGLLAPKVYQGECIRCPHCKERSLYIKSMNMKISEEQLNGIFNVFDVYLQYASCEGAGMPVAEAAACALPTMVIDATAMKDYKNTINSFPIPPSHMFCEPGIQAERACPNNETCVKEIIRLSNQPLEITRREGYRNLELVKKEYCWDRAVNKWLKAIDECPASDWETSESLIGYPSLSDNPTQMFKELSSVLPTFTALDLTERYINQDAKGSPFIGKKTHKEISSMLNTWININNKLEKVRTGQELLADEDYLTYAELQSELFA